VLTWNVTGMMLRLKLVGVLRVGGFKVVSRRLSRSRFLGLVFIHGGEEGQDFNYQ